MPDLVPIPYGNGKCILVEVSDTTTREIEELSLNTTNPVNEVAQNLETVSVTIVETSQIMMGAFQSIAIPPTSGQENNPLVPAKATLEFGIRFTAEGNFYIAKASGEATLKATIEWKFRTE